MRLFMRIVPLGALVLLLAAAGCASPVYLGGEYARPDSDLVPIEPKPHEIYSEDRWTFLWGATDSGKVDAQWNLKNQLHEGQVFIDLDVEDHSTIDGWVISWVTAGFVNHRKVVVKGRKAVHRAEGGTGAWEPTRPGTRSSTD